MRHSVISIGLHSQDLCWVLTRSVENVTIVVIRGRMINVLVHRSHSSPSLGGEPSWSCLPSLTLVHNRLNSSVVLDLVIHVRTSLWVTGATLLNI